jgi:hypothetical protein
MGVFDGAIGPGIPATRVAVSMNRHLLHHSVHGNSEINRAFSFDVTPWLSPVSHFPAIGDDSRITLWKTAFNGVKRSKVRLPPKSLKPVNTTFNRL